MFTDKDKQTMLHVAYVMEELGEAVDYMPMAPSREALTAMYGDLCPSGPPPPAPDWGEGFRLGIEYAAGNSAWLHWKYGRESLLAERDYYESMAREMDEEGDSGW